MAVLVVLAPPLQIPKCLGRLLSSVKSLQDKRIGGVSVFLGENANKIGGTINGIADRSGRWIWEMYTSVYYLIAVVNREKCAIGVAGMRSAPC